MSEYDKTKKKRNEKKERCDPGKISLRCWLIGGINQKGNNVV